MFENAVNLQGYSQKTFTAGGQFPTLLLPGVYDVWSENNVYLKIDKTNAADVTSSTGYLLRTGTTVPVLITVPSFLGAAGTGVVFFHQVK